MITDHKKSQYVSVMVYHHKKLFSDLPVQSIVQKIKFSVKDFCSKWKTSFFLH